MYILLLILLYIIKVSNPTESLQTSLNPSRSHSFDIEMPFFFVSSFLLLNQGYVCFHFLFLIKVQIQQTKFLSFETLFLFTGRPDPESNAHFSLSLSLCYPILTLSCRLPFLARVVELKSQLSRFRFALAAFFSSFPLHSCVCVGVM